MSFEAQYQQIPLPAEGNLIKRSLLRSYHELPDEFADVGLLPVQDVHLDDRRNGEEWNQEALAEYKHSRGYAIQLQSEYEDSGEK